jgi:hypothetical protein
MLGTFLNYERFAHNHGTAFTIHDQLLVSLKHLS